MDSFSISAPTGLASAEVIPYALPFADRYTTATGALRQRDLILVRLTGTDGHCGLGEAVPLTLRGGAVEAVLAELDRWAEWAENETRSEPVGDGERDSRRSEHGVAALSPPAAAGVSTALADLEANRRGIPLWELLGAEAAGPVRCNATLPAGAPDVILAEAERWADRGFSTFKLKVGLEPEPVGPGDRDRDLAQVEAVRSAVGTEAEIRLDANGAWSLERARQAIEAAGEHRIELVEQPVADLGEMARLKEALAGSVPIAADESVTSPSTAGVAVELSACDLVTVKLSKIGRLDPVLDGRLPTYLSSALDGPVGIAAAGHCYQALLGRMPSTAGLAQGLATQLLFGSTVAEYECELEGDLLRLPTGPGLGVRLDPDALSRYATRSLTN